MRDQVAFSKSRNNPFSVGFYLIYYVNLAFKAGNRGEKSIRDSVSAIPLYTDTQFGPRVAPGQGIGVKQRVFGQGVIGHVGFTNTVGEAEPGVHPGSVTVRRGPAR